jgi:hypothetical protein
MLICGGDGEIHHRREDMDDVDSIIKSIILDWEMLKRLGFTDEGVLRFVQDLFGEVSNGSINEQRIKCLVDDETPRFQKDAYELVFKENDPILLSIRNVFVLWKEFLTRVSSQLNTSLASLEKISFCPRRPVDSLRELFSFPIEKRIKRVDPEHEYLELLEGLKRVLKSMHTPEKTIIHPPRKPDGSATLLIDRLLSKIDRCSDDIKAIAYDRVKTAKQINRISTYLIAVNAYII